jgi:hypothetical protein
MNESGFDHRPDEEMGAALREVLSLPDDAGFVQRVLAAVGTAPTWWDVLGAWVRPGIAAALMLSAAGGFWLGKSVGKAEALADLSDPVPAVVDSSDVASLFASSRAPDVDVVLAATRGR